MANTRQVIRAINHTLVASTLTSFPLLLTRANLPAEMFDPTGSNNARSDGGDIRVYADSGAVTEWAREIVSFAYDSAPAAGDGSAEIWVLVPSVSSATDTAAYIEYGDHTLTDYLATATYGSHAVWAADGLVSHDGGLTDTTGNNTISTTYGAPVTTTGLIGSAGSYAVATGDAIAYSPSTTVNNLSNYDLLMVLKMTDNYDGYFLGQMNGYRGSAGNYWRADISGTQAGRPEFKLLNNTGTDITYWPAAGWWTNGDWTVFRYQFENGVAQRVYINGALSTSTTETSISQTGGTSYGPIFGDRYTGSASSTRYQGLIDESRISSVLKSADFISAEYSMFTAPATFAAGGTPGAIGGGATFIAAWARNSNIIIGANP